MTEQTNTTFGAGSPATTADAGTTQGGTPDDPVALLVGEGKKFKTVADLAKGKLESDAFIAQVLNENKALRGLLAKEDTEETTPTNRGKEGTAGPGSNQTSAEPLTTETVLSLMERRDVARQMRENSASFNKDVTVAFGDKAVETVLGRLNELGLDRATFDHLVATAPKSALALVGVKPAGAGQAGAVGSPGGAANTAAVVNHSGGSVKNFAYFENLRKTLGHDYFKPEIQQELFKARKAMGSDFFR